VSVSRRPGDSATISLRPGCPTRKRSTRSTGFSARRFTETSGRARAKRWPSAPPALAASAEPSRAIAQRPKRLASVKKRSASMKTSAGESSGRSGSCARNRWRCPMSSAKARAAASMSPCETTMVCAGR